MYDEEVTIKEEVPECFSFFDLQDPSCRRCPTRILCEEQQAATRPPCFGKLYDEKHERCLVCLDASQCIDHMKVEEKEMARTVVIKRKKRVRRKAEAAQAPPTPEVVREAVATQDYTTWRIAELREELEERGLESSGRKSELVKRMIISDAEAEVEEKAPEPSIAVPELTPSPVPTTPTLADLFAAMEQGQAISVTRISDDNWYIASATASVTTSPAEPVDVKGKGLRGDEYWSEVLSPEYYGWYNQDAGNGKAWSAMTAEEKVDFADDLGVEWEDHDDARVSGLRMVRAIFEELGITKYKAEYKSKKSRDLLR